MAKRLYIVSVYRPELLDELLLYLGVSADSKVVLDRRHGDRRALKRRPADGNERRRASIDRALRDHGFAIVELDDAVLELDDAAPAAERPGRSRERAAAESR